MGKAEQGMQSNQQRYAAIPRVLVFVQNGPDVLLLKGAPDKRLWANRYNGLGGHVEANEDVYATARREVLEEAGLEVHNLRLRGVVNIDVGQKTGIMMFVFSAQSDHRETQASVEGTLEWIPLHNLPRKNLVKDLPLLIERIKTMSDESPPFFARYAYDAYDTLQVTFAERV